MEGCCSILSLLENLPKEEIEEEVEEKIEKNRGKQRKTEENREK